MIREQEVFYIGYLSKYRGLGGEVELAFTDDAFDRGDSEYLVLERDGILVPFFWEEYRFKNDTTAIFKFEEIDTDEAAKQLTGSKVFYPRKHDVATSGSDTLRSLKAFTGFAVYDAGDALLGTVTGVDDSSANTLLYIDTPSKRELIVPLHEDFLCGYDLKGRTLKLDLPEGLLNLND